MKNILQTHNPHARKLIHILISYPDDDTRVKIKGENGDYINASFIEVGAF